MKISDVDSLSDQLAKMLSDYTEDVAEVTKQAVDRNTAMVNDAIKRHAPRRPRSGRYVRAFRIKTKYEDRLNKRNLWYVKAPHYRLTHLLEHDHQNRSHTGRVRGIPHIKYGEEIAQKLDETIAEGIEKL